MFVRGVELDCSAQLSNELLNNADITFVAAHRGPTEGSRRYSSRHRGSVSQAAPHTNARGSDSLKLPTEEIAVSALAASIRIFAKVRSSSLTNNRSADFLPTSSDTFTPVPTKSSSTCCRRWSLLSVMSETECDAMVAKRWRNTIGLLRRFLSQDDANVVAVGVDRYRAEAG